MKNHTTELKEAKKQAKVHWSDVADLMGVSESTLYKFLRHKMADDTKNQIVMAIQKAAEQHKGAV